MRRPATGPVTLAGNAELVGNDGPAAIRELVRRHRGPVVRPSDRPGWYDVSFVFIDRDRAATRVGLVCPALAAGITEMEAIGEGIFVTTLSLPAGTRVPYHFCPALPPPDDRDPFALAYSLTNRRIDYANPLYDQITISSLRTRLVESLLCLPGSGPRPVRQRRGEPRHGAAQTLELDSVALGHAKQVVLYRPSAPPPPVGYPLVLLLASADEWEPAELLFDQLLDDDRLDPFVGAWVGGGRFTTRMRDLGRRDGALGRFVREELLALVGRSAPLDPARCAIGGFSAGAVGALTVALDEPGLFAAAALISGAFHLGERMEVIRPHAAREHADAWWGGRDAGLARVYLAAGQYEDRWQPPAYGLAARVAAALSETGARIRLDTGPTGHDTVSARAYLTEGLAWLLDLESR